MSDPDFNPYCMRCSKHLGRPFHETNEHDEARQAYVRQRNFINLEDEINNPDKRIVRDN